MRHSPTITLLLIVHCCTIHADGVQPADHAPKNEEQSIGRDIVDLYEQAVAATEKVCDDYRRIRAMQLARQRDIAFSEAYENIQSVMPILKPVNKELLRRAIRDPNDLKEHEDEVNTVKKEIEVVIELTTKLLLEIEVIHMPHADHEHREKTLEEIVQQKEFDPELVIKKGMEMGEERKIQMQKLAEAAKQDEKRRAKDLTPLMQKPKPDIKDLTKKDQERLKRQELKPFKSGGTDGAGFVIKPEEVVLARKFREGGAKAEWMFVDTWYTIGPFPNPARIFLDRKFPPETVVDLDATYIGKNGKLIQWKFRQSREPKVIPADAEEYGIWYAYTEVYMDRPCDLWVAIGSDDKGHVWLNDQPIWISGDRLKGWYFGEGFRKVHFKAGRNTILYRIENGHFKIAFSLGIRVAK